MRKVLYMISTVLLYTITSCGNVNPETSDLMVSITAGEATETELSFTVTSENAENCAWMCVEKGETLPSDTDIMSKGKVAFANTSTSAKATNLKDGCSYVIIAAAMSGDNIVVSTPVEMTTLEKPVQPTARLSSGMVNADNYTFTITYADAEKVAYKVYDFDAKSSADDILSTGTVFNAESGSSVTIGNLEDGVYYVQAAVKHGETKALSEKLTFTINTTLPTYTINVTYASINPELQTNGRNFLVRFYFMNQKGSQAAVALDFFAPTNGNDYLPAGNYILGGAEGTARIDPEYTYFDKSYAKFTEGYCNVTITSDKKYIFDIRLTREEDESDYSGEVFVLNWTGTVNYMPIL